MLPKNLLFVAKSLTFETLYGEKTYTLEGIVKDSKPFQNYFNACHNLSEICAANNDGRDVIRFDGHGYSWKQMLNNKKLNLKIK